MWLRKKEGHTPKNPIRFRNEEVIWYCPFYFFLLLFHILQIQKCFHFYQNSVLFKSHYLMEKLILLSPGLGLPFAKALSSGSQTPGSSFYAKGVARADPHIHVDSSLKSMLLTREEGIQAFLLPFAKGKKKSKGSSTTLFSFQH